MLSPTSNFAEIPSTVLVEAVSLGPVQSSASLLPHFDQCWTASPSSSTSSFPWLFHTTSLKVMFLNSFNSWNKGTSTPTLHHKSTIKTSLASSRVLTRIALSPVGILHYTSSAPPWTHNPMNCSPWNPPWATKKGTWSKGRTCRTLNVTRKIYIRDIESIIRASLDMTQFSIGTAVFPADPGFTYGLSTQPCLMPHGCSPFRRSLVSHLQVPAFHHGSYFQMSPLRGQSFVPPRLLLGDRTSLWVVLAPRFLRQTHRLGDWAGPGVPWLHLGVWPFTLRYSPPHDLNQVMAPFSASPLSVQLSGFVSRLFLVAKCAHPSSEQFRGFAALHRLYRQAGFRDEDLITAARPISKYMHTRHLW